LVRQGHYARDPKILASYAPADVSIKYVGDLLNYQLQELKPHLAKRTRSIHELSMLIQSED